MEPGLEAVLAHSLDRVRRKCTHKTVYNHDQLQAWLLECLPDGWTTHVPSVLGRKALSARWPSNQKERAGIKKWLVGQDCIEEAAADDLIDGACEPLALHLAKAVEVVLHWEGLAPALVPDRAHAIAVDRLKSLGPLRASVEVFGCGFAAGHGSWNPIVWGQRYATMSIGELLCGTDTARDIMCRLVAEMQFRQWHTAWMPLYILNYIWCEKELTDEEMALADAETAQYSCHVVGLVLDARRRALYVADPNGGLIPGVASLTP